MRARTLTLRGGWEGDGTGPWGSEDSGGVMKGNQPLMIGNEAQVLVKDGKTVANYDKFH